MSATVARNSSRTARGTNRAARADGLIYVNPESPNGSPEPRSDGFRNYRRNTPHFMAPEESLIDKAPLLRISAPDMTALVSGLRVLGANAMGSKDGVFTNRVGVLTNDVFVNLLDMDTMWTATEDENAFVGLDRATHEPKWTATRVDLVFGSNSQLRALAEAYATADAGPHLVNAFVAAWVRVMDADRFDVSTGKVEIDTVAA